MECVIALVDGKIQLEGKKYFGKGVVAFVEKEMEGDVGVELWDEIAILNLGL
jgi:hypothetical protein